MQLEDLFSRANELPSIPEVVQELIAGFDDNSLDADDIGRKIAMDQVLTAKVLRLANSARYGSSRDISQISEAVVRLGINQIRTLVLASSFTAAFKAPAGFDIKSFWQDSFRIAELGRWIAGFAGDEAETVFTCGMVSNIGRLLVHMSLSEKAQEIDRVVEKGGNRHEMERIAWGFTSDDASAGVAAKWKFPERIVTGVKYQSCPWDAGTEKRMASLIYLARFLNDSLNRELADEEIIATFPNQTAADAGLDLSRMLDNIAEIHGLDAGLGGLLE
ncbi:HDOD domain-containing protein [Granulosicoccaceae sp. 1_MG-2023]|nr:HDOD domain-containing protein [Granulosicoccaceae sp. 1_MG-2023]